MNGSVFIQQGKPRISTSLSWTTSAFARRSERAAYALYDEL